MFKKNRPQNLEIGQVTQVFNIWLLWGQNLPFSETWPIFKIGIILKLVGPDRVKILRN